MKKVATVKGDQQEIIRLKKELEASKQREDAALTLVCSLRLVQLTKFENA